MNTHKAIITLALLGLSGTALATDSCTINIQGDDRMQFNIQDATVSAACPNIVINLEHTGKLPVAAMGHNVVISKTSDVPGLAADSIKAGADAGYLPPNDERVIGATEMIGGGEKSKASFEGKTLDVGGDYTFFCSFPGHSSIMKGKLNVIP